jgi:hypothetical protein
VRIKHVRERRRLVAGRCRFVSLKCRGNREISESSKTAKKFQQ